MCIVGNFVNKKLMFIALSLPFLVGTSYAMEYPDYTNERAVDELIKALFEKKNTDSKKNSTVDNQKKRKPLVELTNKPNQKRVKVASPDSPKLNPFTSVQPADTKHVLTRTSYKKYYNWRSREIRKRAKLRKTNKRLTYQK